MKKSIQMAFLLIMVLGSLSAKNECTMSSVLINKIEKKYYKKIALLSRKNGIFSNWYFCNKVINNENNLLILPYINKNEIEEGMYDLSMIIGLIKNNKLTSSKFIKNIISTDNGSFLSEVIVNTTNYRAISNNLTVSIIIESGANSNVNLYKEKKLFLYERYENTFRTLISDFIIEQLSTTESKGLKMVKINSIFFDKKKHYPYPPITFKFLTTFESKSKIKKQEVLKKVLFFDKNKYYVPTVKIDMDFLKGIEKNVRTKKYLYDKGFFKEYLLETPINKKTLTTYNNIAYYLQKAGSNEEAVYLLEKILEKFPKRMVAYYNLGDAYWALGDKKKAKEAYTTYIEQMCDVGKQKRIPKVVMDRISSK